MGGPELAFWVLAVLGGVSTVAVVAVPNIVHAALALVGALLAAAGIFVIFGAEFVGLAQILIYVGAVVILFLFGIMLTSARASKTRVDNDQRLVAIVIAVCTFAVLAAGILAAFGGQTLELRSAFPTGEIGTEMFTKWILPFEAVSVLLLAALVGAIVLARRD